MRILISPLTAADVERVSVLARRVWQQTYPAIISQQQIDFMLAQRYNPARLLDELGQAGYWWDLVHVDGELAGFASCLLTASGEMKLDKIYVDEKWQRIGVGARLIARAVTRALEAGCNTLILAVNKNNRRAIAAYEKSGFSVREAVRVDIGDGFVMDDFIMARSLTEPAAEPPSR